MLPNVGPLQPPGSGSPSPFESPQVLSMIKGFARFVRLKTSNIGMTLKRSVTVNSFETRISHWKKGIVVNWPFPVPSSRLSKIPSPSESSGSPRR